MVAWSTLARSAGQNFQGVRLFMPKVKINNAILNSTQTRLSNSMVIKSSTWQWHMSKDKFHYFFFLAAIPLSIITFCANVFVGPATLTPIPEGYVPKHWEYYRSPITRFLARYIYRTPQKDYEKCLHAIYEEQELIKIRKLNAKVQEIQTERQDYKYKYFLPFYNKPARESREILEHNSL